MKNCQEVPTITCATAECAAYHSLPVRSSVELAIVYFESFLKKQNPRCGRILTEITTTFFLKCPEKFKMFLQNSQSFVIFEEQLLIKYSKILFLQIKRNQTEKSPVP